MSKREYILRYLSIIKLLRSRKGVSFDEISAFLKSESEFHGYTLNISKRTFQRDLSEILSLFNIDIQYSFSRKVYFIAGDEAQSELSERMLDAFDLYNALNTASKFSQHIIFEKRRAQGMEHFSGLIHAIQNRIVVAFSYHKFWEEEPTERSVEPYSLKEFKGRWYLICKDKKDNRIKTFGLDRISQLDFTKQKFSYPKDLNVAELFRDSFGIINPDDSNPEEIVLSFEPTQGKYIKSFPLHESQQIVKDSDDELRIKLKLHITHDLIMEFLSHGDALKVISPANLKKNVRNSLLRTLKQYK